MELSAHLEVAGAPDRAAMHIGVFLAWCVNHDLVSETLKRQHADLLLKVRVRELDGSELLVRIAAGQLLRELLSEAGTEIHKQILWKLLGRLCRSAGAGSRLSLRCGRFLERL